MKKLKQAHDNWVEGKDRFWNREVETELLEPLVVALRLRQDEEVNVAREIYEVAHDVIDRIEARSKDMIQNASEDASDAN